MTERSKTHEARISAIEQATARLIRAANAMHAQAGHITAAFEARSREDAQRSLELARPSHYEAMAALADARGVLSRQDDSEAEHQDAGAQEKAGGTA